MKSEDPATTIIGVKTNTASPTAATETAKKDGTSRLVPIEPLMKGMIVVGTRFRQLDLVAVPL
jgi:hypothetical protein